MSINVHGFSNYFQSTNNNGTPAPEGAYIARWDGSTWSALGHGAGSNGSLNNVVRSLAVSGSNVYAGGDFTDVNNAGVVLAAADHLAKWDGTNWSALGSNGAGDGALSNYSSPFTMVNALVASDRNLYVGGYFYDVSNNGSPLLEADNIAAYGTNRALYLPLVRH